MKKKALVLFLVSLIAAFGVFGADGESDSDGADVPECGSQYRRDSAACRALGETLRRACWASAAQRLGACVLSKGANLDHPELRTNIES